MVNSDGANRKCLFDSDDRTKISSFAFNVENGVLVVGKFSALNAYVLRKVGIGTIRELSCAKWEFSLCCAFPEW